MVLDYIEKSNDKPSRCGYRRWNCFHSIDNLDLDPSLAATEILKGLILCANVAEMNLLVDTSRIMEMGKFGMNKLDLRWIVIEVLRAIGYDAIVCKFRWEESPYFLLCYEEKKDDIE